MICDLLWNLLNQSDKREISVLKDNDNKHADIITDSSAKINNN